MTQETRFSRIAVTADDEDDFVIEAGAPQTFAQAPTGSPDVSDQMPVVESDPAVDSGLGSIAEQAEISEFAPVASVRKPEPAHELKPEPAPARKSADAYETTLEDLDSVSMSGVQKAVIAIAILAVVAFVAFQFLA